MALNDNEWQSLVTLAEWQADKLLFYAIKHSIKSANAIKGVSPNAIKCHKSTKSFPFSAFRFPFFANFAKANG